ncbi:hypothetical protein MRB53_011012 [Persea americana]|uniref:Uncharacterized protein n=1 Tax=Persea americana TaxID=3435 RepID=A0ACC2LTL7_PERAE|nr:hypothetical protein MRB53_011012 [Persea americana]|eukprot:TRINITY_DN380_c0_g1_i11.p2 TRINITY_DN380_c0_g1~~TRINITY_DN380_c0_g1_i11.p2  ORF type:complete len:151 (+),score=15.52 TRINITY_DN380_c0_g1_i11:576-1028(+)
MKEAGDSWCSELGHRKPALPLPALAPPMLGFVSLVSSLVGCRWSKEIYLIDAASTTTGPAAINAPVTFPPITCPLAPTRVMVISNFVGEPKEEGCDGANAAEEANSDEAAEGEDGNTFDNVAAWGGLNHGGLRGASGFAGHIDGCLGLVF